jgi:hypothetical protein
MRVALLILLAAAPAYAEDVDPIHIDTGVLGTYTRSNGRGGAGAVFETKYMLDDDFAIGGRLEAAVMFGGSFGSTGDTQMEVGAVGALMAKGEWYFGEGVFRPFVGLGAGVFDIASQSIATTSMTASVDQKAGRYFGIAPQLGLNLSRVRLAVTYDMILGADIEVHQTIGNAMQTTSYSQSYFGAELSFRFGGEPRPHVVANVVTR